MLLLNAAKHEPVKMNFINIGSFPVLKGAHLSDIVVSVLINHVEVSGSSPAECVSVTQL